MVEEQIALDSMTLVKNNNVLESEETTLRTHADTLIGAWQ